ncbi:uncharacterized protein LOC128499603 [Spea bombifrons]|uniref:uncharacterized protein LOC128499603 n=1 Tax=Spea bombifrons TaxID=233779 RepID=UPI002349133C|nr:uncharacterized protein LOC128499603 [Spea bombifrons]
MKRLAGIVQLLFLQIWILKGRTMPVNSTGCKHTSICNDITTILTQIQNKIREMHTVDQNLSDEYALKNGFTRDQGYCNPKSFGPHVNLKNISEEERFFEMHKTFLFLSDVLTQVAEYQGQLNANQKSFLKQLSNTVNGIKAISSNLSCLLCQKYNRTQENENYEKPFPTHQKDFQKKVWGCKVVTKYKDFISEAAGIDFVKPLTPDQK